VPETASGTSVCARAISYRADRGRWPAHHRDLRGEHLVERAQQRAGARGDQWARGEPLLEVLRDRERIRDDHARGRVPERGQRVVRLAADLRGRRRPKLERKRLDVRELDPHRLPPRRHAPRLRHTD
jgi:hypothetical protein